MNTRGGDRSGWCILRTSPGRTLPLAQSLVDAGIEAWTPTETHHRAKTRRRKAADIDAPIMPTFVFVRESEVAAVRRILMLPISPHPAFSLFRYGGGVPVVAEGEIAGLRAAEERARRREQRSSKRRPFQVGERVRVPEGAFAGLTGIVEGGDGKIALVHMGFAMPVKIATYLLQQDVDEKGTDQIQDVRSRTGVAA